MRTPAATLPIADTRATRIKSDSTPPRAGELIKVTTLEDLARYRDAVCNAKRLGGPRPVAVLPEGAPTPKSVKALMDAIDELLPKMITDKGISFDAIFDPGEGYKRGVASPWQNTVLGANFLAAGLLAFEIAGQLTGLKDVVVMLGVAHAAWKAAGLTNAAVHFTTDEYPWLKDRAMEFQIHHDLPGESSDWDMGHASKFLGRFTLPLLIATAAMGPGVAVGTAALVYMMGHLLSMSIHQYQHTPASKRPKWVLTLQKLGIAGTDHLKHHAGRTDGLMSGEVRHRHADAYDIFTGDLGGNNNDLLDGLEVFHRARRAIYLLTGTEPNSWAEFPELKEIWTTPEERAHVEARGRVAEIKREIADVEREIEAGGPDVAKQRETLAGLRGSLRELKPPKMSRLRAFFAPKGQKEVSREVRIGKYNELIAELEQSLANAIKTQRDPDAEPDKQKMAERSIVPLTDRLERMRTQLACFEDPSKLAPLLQDVQTAKQKTLDLVSPIGMRMKMLNPKGYEEKAAGIQAEIDAAVAAVRQAAPYLTV